MSSPPPLTPPAPPNPLCLTHTSVCACVKTRLHSYTHARTPWRATLAHTLMITVKGLVQKAKKKKKKAHAHTRATTGRAELHDTSRQLHEWFSPSNTLFIQYERWANLIRRNTPINPWILFQLHNSTQNL